MHFTVLYFCVWVMISLNCDVISLSGPMLAPWTVLSEELNILWFLSSNLITLLCVYISVLYYNRKQPDMVWYLTLVNYLCRPGCGQFMIVLKTLDITMTSQWAWWRLRSPASRLFTQPFIRAQIKENFKVPRHWPLCGEYTGTGEFPHKRPVTRKMFPFDDVIMSTHLYTLPNRYLLSHLKTSQT